MAKRRKLRLKKLHNQVIVITGATSGIGLTTARLAASRGARVVLCSRNSEELERLCAELNRRYPGSRGRAIGVVADVADTDAVQRVADEAIREFGGFDSWVNNAAVSIYGELTRVEMIEKRRLFDVNFWGTVNGCRSAVRHFRHRGGAIINLGSIASERAIPLQGIYSASKHAVKAYTDALRMELEHEGAPISVTLVKPGTISTPYVEHARAHVPGHPTLPSPAYTPDVVARAILRCCEHPVRDVHVGASAKALSLLEKFAPRLTDRSMERRMWDAQIAEGPERAGPDSLFRPAGPEGREQSEISPPVFTHSLYTSLSLRPGRALGVALGGLVGLQGLRRLKRRRSA